MTTTRMTAPRTFALGMLAAGAIALTIACADPTHIETPDTSENIDTVTDYPGGGIPNQPEIIHEDDPGFDCRTMGNMQCGIDLNGETYILDFSNNTFSPASF